MKPPRPSSALPPPDMPRGTTSIVFGENQLSPRLIGLSPLPTAHPNIFQHERVRPSTRCYPSFSLAMGRSPRFRVYRHALLGASSQRPLQTRFRFGSTPQTELNLARDV